MKLIDIALLGILAVILGLTVLFLYRSKKQGKSCVGCPDGCCPAKGGGGCSCCQGCNEKT